LATKGAKRLNVLVRFGRKPTAGQLTTLRTHGADVYRNLSIINTVAVSVSKDKLRGLLQLPFINHVSLDANVQKTDAFTVGSSEANVAWQQYGATGNGVAVAVIDSGVGEQLDFDGSNGGLLSSVLGLLSTRVLTQVGFVPGDGVNDDCGHGTHVAGIIAGNAASSSGLLAYNSYSGVAPQANIVSVKVLNSTGGGTVSQVISGIQWVIANKAKYNIGVINLSLGHPVGESYTQDPLCQAVETAWKDGIVVVCAAGNDGRLNANATPGDPNEGYDTNYGSVEVPGNDPYVITVGAMKSIDGSRPDDEIATYSSRGPAIFDYTLKPDIVAPGNQVISVEQPNAYLVNTYKATNQVPYDAYTVSLTPSKSSNNYFILSGTSMATPVVAGAAAMLLQLHPNISPDTIKLRLMSSADKWTDPEGNADACTYGAGYLNIPAACGSTLVATQYAMSPFLSLDASGDVFVNYYGNVNWNRAIWGSSSVQSMQAIWGKMAIWGSSCELSASNAIWGKSCWFNEGSASISSAGVDLSAGGIWIQGEH
jgi:serine protease AprX